LPGLLSTLAQTTSPRALPGASPRFTRVPHLVCCRRAPLSLKLGDLLSRRLDGLMRSNGPHVRNMPLGVLFPFEHLENLGPGAFPRCGTSVSKPRVRSGWPVGCRRRQHCECRS
jgi:hypothetical protein